MNINRHNYEEFFLLYVDNELSASERNAVELFVEQNPDLGKELQQLQQSIVPGDKISFEDKKSLLKEEDMAALQEKLLLFADEELPYTERIQIETLVATNAVAAAEWNILQQTKLQADTTIVFEDKRSLYRTAGGRIVGFKWWRVAAAAVLLGFGTWTGITLYRNNNKTNTSAETIANGNKNDQQQVFSPDSMHNAPVQPILKEKANTETVKAPPVQKDVIESSTEKNNPALKKNDLATEKEVEQKNPRKKNEVIIAKEEKGNEKSGNNLPKPVLENINNRESNKTEIAIVQPKTTDENKNNLQITNSHRVPVNKKNEVAARKTEKGNESVKTIPDINTATSTNVVAKNAVYIEGDDAKNDNKILYMDEDKVKRSRIGGIFRKIKRVIERKTNIKPGNGIKVAGFEIAIK